MPSRTVLPMPAPDQVRYKSILKEGFKTFPERENNYLKYQEAKRGAKVDYLPIRVDIENVSRCNYHCTMCQVSDWDHFKRAEDMSISDYKKFMKEQYGLIEIKIQGMGEPLLSQDFFEMVKFARDRHIWVRSTNNGSLLHIKDNYKKLIDSDINEAIISIDGATDKTYETIRRGGKFKMVTRNCKMLNKYAVQNTDVRVRMWSVVQKENFHELEKFPALAGELGFNHLTFSLDLNDWGQDSWRDINDPVDMHNNFDIERAQNLISDGQQHGVDVTFWYLDEKYDFNDEHKLCPWPFERSFISSDMRVVPCCMISNPEIYDLGDARKFNDIWNGNDLQKFRQDHIDGNLPDICRTCYKHTSK